jgi:hypothetical protein
MPIKRSKFEMCGCRLTKIANGFLRAGCQCHYGVTVFQDGSWHVGDEPYPENPSVSGQDLQSLFDYLVEKGLVRK